MVDGDEKKFATAGLLIIPQSLAVSNKTVTVYSYTASNYKYICLGSIT